jgi:RimJ/RimL family protein N-acetyltransferase
MQLLLKHGFATLNLHLIYLRVYEDNQRAIRAYEKAGFKDEGRLRQMIYKDGDYLDVIFMSVLHTEWQENDQ